MPSSPQCKHLCKIKVPPLNVLTANANRKECALLIYIHVFLFNFMVEASQSMNSETTENVLKLRQMAIIQLKLDIFSISQEFLLE